MSDSIAITGVGLISAFGLTPDDAWRAVVAGRCGVGALGEIECELPAGKDGCQAVALPGDYEPNLPREARYLRYTIRDALRDAKIGTGESLEAGDRRCAIMLGTTLHGMRAAGRYLRTQNFDELRDFLAGDTLRLATRGMTFTAGAATTCSACSSSLGSVALAITLLRSGQADLVVAGGYDTVSEYVWAGFNALRLVADGPLRPFAKDRRGMKLGEGYGIVVLERADEARKRDATVHAIVAGYGESADAHHLTQPHPGGEGAERAMRAALESAGITADDLSLIAAHATGTPDNDAAEHAALARLLGDRIGNVPVVSFKSHLGHTLGGAGAVELILSMFALRDGIVPACANVTPDEIEFPGLRLATGPSQRRALRFALNTSLGFGGANTCVVLTTPAHERKQPTQRASKPREVWITGIGVVLADAVGNEAFVQRLASSPKAWQSPPRMLRDEEFEHLLNARRVRRMSSYVKVMLAAAALACRDAALIDRPDLLADTSAILGTMHGAANFSFDYYGQLVREGVLAANPMLFAEGVPNVGAAQLSLMLGLKRACQTIIGTRTAGLDALRLAALRIENGEADRVVVGAAEERTEIVDRAYEHCGLRSAGASCAPFSDERGFCSTNGSVSLILETPDSARSREARPYAVFQTSAAMSDDRETLSRTIANVLAALGPSQQLISCANGTWLDRAEQRGIARLHASPEIVKAYEPFGEIFSATPLVGIAAALLSGAPVDRFDVLCSDWSGSVSAVSFRSCGR